jgi:hypothetical protein
MKKLVLFAAVALSMSVFSCGNGEKGEAVDSDTVAAVVEEPVQADTVAAPADSVAPAAEAPAAE